MANYKNTDLFETVYTDPSEQDWKLVLRSQIPIYTGQPLGEGASPLSAETGYVVRWTWNNNNDPDTGGNFPGLTHTQLDDATNSPFTSYASAEAYTLASTFIDSDLIDHSTVVIVSASDESVPQNWYYYNLDMAYPGLSIRWEGDADDPNKSILGSGADVSVYVNDAQEAILTDAILQTEFNLSLSVYKKDDAGDYVDWWHGIALPESASSEVKDGRRLMDLSFTDGLSLLNDIDFKNDDGTRKTGQLSFKQTIMQSLRRLPHFDQFTFQQQTGTGFVLDDVANAPEFGYAFHQLHSDYSGDFARLTNDISLSSYVDVGPGDDLTPYDGYKVLFMYDQFGSNPLFQFTYTSMPELDASARALKFSGAQCMTSGLGLMTGDVAKTAMVSIDTVSDTTTQAIFGQGNFATSGTGEVFMWRQENDQYGMFFDGGSSRYATSTNATIQNQVLKVKAPAAADFSDYELYSDGTQISLSTGGGTALVDTQETSTHVGARLAGSGATSEFLTGNIHSIVVWNDNVPTPAEEALLEAELAGVFQDGGDVPEGLSVQKGGWALSTYGTPMPVVDGATWDPSLSDPLSEMFCQAETFNEPKKEYDRKFEMRPDPAFMSTGHVIEDLCKTLGMVLTQWEGGWHLFNPTYLTKATNLYSLTNDSTLAPMVRRWTFNITDGLQEDIYEAVNIDLELEDYAAPSSGMTKSYTLPYRTVQLVHEKSPSDILYQSYSSASGSLSAHKLSASYVTSGVDFSTATNMEKYGDARLGHQGRNATHRKKRLGTMWSMSDAYYADGHDYDANGGAQGSDLSPRAQHKRLEDGTTGGGPNLKFYDGRYLGPDSSVISDVDLEAGETFNIEMGGYVENGRLDDHIGQTYIWHHRVELRQEDGTKYRLRRHVITQDTWTDNGTERKLTIEGSNSDVDKGWPGDKTYYVKEYDSLAWVKEADVTANEWEDCWYEVMSFHPETTKTEGDDLAETNLTALPYYGNAPMGTVWNEDDQVLDVDNENRFAYVKADISVVLPGIEGADEFEEVYVECGLSMYNPSQGPRPVHGFAGNSARFASRKAAGGERKTPGGGAVQITGGSSVTGRTTDMPYVMGWNKFVIRYGDAGEKNSLETYGDGGTGTRTYKAGSSRLGSRFVFTNPEFRGRIKVRHQDGSGGLLDKTFFTQWRPAWAYYVPDLYNASLHDLIAYEYLDVLGYIRPRYVGSWQKHPGTTQGGCPAPFLPVVTRCLEPNSAVRVTPYRMDWKFAEGFKFEAVKIADAYEKERVSYVLGDTADGGSSGGTQPALGRLGRFGSQAAQANLRPQVELVGSGDSSIGGSSAPHGTFNYLTGVDDGTGIFFEELYATNPTYVGSSTSYMTKFDLVDANNFALYGAGNLGRLVVQEPGTYMVELKGTMDNNLSSGTNTYGFAMHRLGTVSSNTYTGDTSLKATNIMENLATESNSGGSGNLLSGIFTEQIVLGRGEVITFSAYNTGGSTTASVFTSPDELKIRLIKLSEQPG